LVSDTRKFDVDQYTGVANHMNSGAQHSLESVESVELESLSSDVGQLSEIEEGLEADAGQWTGASRDLGLSSSSDCEVGMTTPRTRMWSGQHLGMLSYRAAGLIGATENAGVEKSDTGQNARVENAGVGKLMERQTKIYSETALSYFLKIVLKTSD